MYVSYLSLATLTPQHHHNYPLVLVRRSVHLYYAIGGRVLGVFWNKGEGYN